MDASIKQARPASTRTHRRRLEHDFSPRTGEYLRRIPCVYTRACPRSLPDPEPKPRAARLSRAAVTDTDDALTRETQMTAVQDTHSERKGLHGEPTSQCDTRVDVARRARVVVVTPLLRICRDSSLTVVAKPVYTLVLIGIECCSGGRHRKRSASGRRPMRTIRSDLRLRGCPCAR